MSSSSIVWVQLYYEGKDEPVGNPIFIKKESLDPPIIGALAEAVKNKLEKELGHAGLTEIFVHPFSEQTPFRGDKTLEGLSTNFDEPLIVVAPAPPQRDAPTQANDEQSGAILTALANLEEKIDDMATVSQPMSNATLNFTQSLFQELNLNYSVCPLVNDTGDGPLDVYEWGENEQEHEGLLGCQAILERVVLPFEGNNGKALGFFDVRNRTLPELKRGKFKSNGFSDLALGDAISIEHAMKYSADLVLAYADALVELKRGNSPLKHSQLLLQLASVSMMSNKKNGVVVLGTDCAAKWCLLYFSAYNHVEIKPYSHGKKCLEDLKELLRTEEERSKMVAPVLQRIPEVDELSLEDFGIAETDSDKAINREASLNKLASALGHVFCENETPIVPHWARATSCPSYYM